MLRLDLSTQLHIVPHLNGVTLLRPSNDRLHPTVNEVMDFPCNAYFLDTESTILNINTHSVEACGYVSTRDAIGTTVFDVLTKDNARLITSIDRQVINQNRTQISEDVMIRNDGTMMNFLTVKAPVYNDKNNIVGIFGCSVMLNNHPLANSLALIAKTGILNNSRFRLPHMQSCTDLTPREMDIARLLVRGKTAKEIAMVLYISPRTVEHYIENIKSKFNVVTKSELIEKILSD